MSDDRLTRRADQDLIDIYLFTLENFGLKQAERYTDGMRSCLSLLADNPRMGRSAEAIRNGLRRHEHGNHVIFNSEDDQTGGVPILAITHTRMRPDVRPDDVL